MASSNLIDVTHLSKKVRSGEREIQILKDVNLAAVGGETIAILGASGSGKTTLLSLMAGLLLPDSGSVSLVGCNMTNLSEDERAAVRQQHVGFIFQSFQLLPFLTALENVMLPLDLRYVAYSEANKQASHWLSKLGLQDRMHHHPAQLSGGEQQRVAIARAFVSCPSVIFADEMTGNLDEKTGHAVIETMFELQRASNVTIVLATHDKELAARCHTRKQLMNGALQAI